MNKEFESKIKDMGLDDLVVYRKTANSMDMFISLIGISCILFAFFFPSLFVVVPCAFFAFLACDMSVNIGKAKRIIDERILKLLDK